MIHITRFVFAVTLLSLLAGSTHAGDADNSCMYSVANIYSFFNDQLRAELKVTTDQQRGLDASRDRRDAIWREYIQARQKVINSNLPEREKNPKLRAQEIQAVDDMCKVYSETLRSEQVKRMKQIVLQMRGIAIFEFPEVQKALKIGDAEAKQLHNAWDKWARDAGAQLNEDVAAKKITKQQAGTKAGNLTRSVPKEIRESLSREQRRVLDDLLGEKFNYK
jgi:hypothetical protein